jgi:subtilisin family serine protease
MDTGIAYHDDLNVVLHYHCIPNQPIGDRNGHGTMVAGLLAAKDNQIGIVGAAPGATLVDLKISEDGSTTPQAIETCLRYAISTHTDPDPSNDIWIINMSLVNYNFTDPGCSVYVTGYKRAFCDAYDAGINIIVAAGNDSLNFTTLKAEPAEFEQVLTVTSFSDTNGEANGPNQSVNVCRDDLDGVCSAESNYTTPPVEDSTHTIAAPGGPCSITTRKDGGYTYCEHGTSLAAPLVAGTLAVCWVGGGRCASWSPSINFAHLREDAFQLGWGWSFLGSEVGGPVGNPTRYYGPNALTQMRY